MTSPTIVINDVALTEVQVAFVRGVITSYDLMLQDESFFASLGEAGAEYRARVREIHKLLRRREVS